MVFTSWAHTSVTVFAGMVATLATGVAITVGLQIMIRSHNTRKTMSRFKRRKRNAMAVFKDTEKYLACTLSPQLAVLRKIVFEGVASDTPSIAASSNKTVLQLRELEEMLLRSLERLGAVRPDAVAEEALSAECCELTGITDGAGARSTTALESCKMREDTSHMIDGSESNSESGAFEAAESNHLNNLSQQASLIDDMNLSSADSLTKTRMSSSTAETLCGVSTVDTSIVSHLLPNVGPSFLNAYPAVFFFDTDQLPAKDMDHLRDSVKQLRLLKRSLVKRHHAIACEVDGLFERLLMECK
ncbi:hypothetical protein BJ741DRAFT_606108 [Chytriomyces cf. hyalinus JEL632]|nr:hypothetical protein BJ741DRAFT_606108 [Chytriomyces cf. hyalinus JEL632]